MAAYTLAQDRFASWGVDTETALNLLASTPISLHCWQGDDVGGFEGHSESFGGGGTQATGNYPGKARNFQELCADLDKTISLIPGKLRLNLHASYANFPNKKADRDALTVDHFQGWIEWARDHKLGIDFNPTCYGHPKAADGFTLSHRDPAVRQFWIDHCVASRRIGAAIGSALGTPAVTNLWIPDGYKDVPVDRLSPRHRLQESLDIIFAAKVDQQWNIDAVECKLFGIGFESYTVGSHEFYLGYAAQKGLALCLDAGHFHPTESVADKISSALLFVPRLLLHVSRGVRWDSDHVVSLDDPTKAILEEVVACQALDRVHIGLDFFDASINRLAAWIIGTRNTQKAVLIGLLRPFEKLRELENTGDHTGRLTLIEESKSLPWGAVWDEFCRRQEVPLDGEWLSVIKEYEIRVLANRSSVTPQTKACTVQ
jgi:L-rhamnose isomerase